MAKAGRGEGGSGRAPFVRVGGRPLDEMREVRAQIDYILPCPGSCLFEMGNTRVLCTAMVEDHIPPHKRGTGEGWVTAEYSMLPRSGTSRVPRERSRGGRSMEIQRLIGRSMRAVVDLSLLGERTIYIDCDVLQADGGTRCAAITGGYMALARAVDTLVRAEVLRKSPLRCAVAAVSVGIVGGTPILDLEYGEDAEADVDMNVVMTGEGRFVELQATAEGCPFRKSELNRLLTLAGKGIARLLELQARFLARARRPAGA